jgi:hypothetical protein
MGFRPPNYRQQRGDRDRVKQQKRKERLERRDAEAAERRAEREALLRPADAAGQTDSAAADSSAPPVRPGENE